MSEPFIGEIRMMPYTFAPRNWAYCDGQLLPISQNPSLYAILSSMWGGDGRTTMAVPNLQGRTPMGPGQGPGLSYRPFSYPEGTPDYELYEAETPAHTHGTKVKLGMGTQTTPNGGAAAISDDIVPYRKDPVLQQYTAMAAGALKTAGGGLEHENRQPYLVVPFCIALDGLFPSRN